MRIKFLAIAKPTNTAAGVTGDLETLTIITAGRAEIGTFPFEFVAAANHNGLSVSKTITLEIAKESKSIFSSVFYITIGIVISGLSVVAVMLLIISAKRKKNEFLYANL